MAPHLGRVRTREDEKVDPRSGEVPVLESQDTGG